MSCISLSIFFHHLLTPWNLGIQEASGLLFCLCCLETKKTAHLEVCDPPCGPVAFDLDLDRGGLKLSELISDAQKALGAVQGYNNFLF